MSLQVYPPQQTIVSLPICKLLSHPDNPNRMSKAKYNKLIRHIEHTGQYEPLVVRKHPTKPQRYQILNGHHRLRVLKQLKRTHADCIVFEANDEQAQVYLLSLNRLCGRDNTFKKAKLIERLCRTHSSRELSRLLGDSKSSIEKLNTLSQNQPLPKQVGNKPFLLPMTFFVTDVEHRLITEAFDEAVGKDESGTRTEKHLRALCRIAKYYLAKDVF